MESHKIRRLDFISDKIEGGDSKREVICIRFGHPTKKNEFVWGSPWEAAMTRLEAPWELMGSSPERGRRRGRTRGAVGRCRGGGLGLAFAGCCSWAAPYLLSLCCACCGLLCVREKRRKKKGEEKKRKEKKRKEKKRKKYEKKFKLEIFWKKDNLWSWSKIIFV
jgi:hypothetical protein